MKTFFFPSIVLFLIGNFTFGQDKGISEFDLLGCWTMEPITKENGLKKRALIPYDIPDAKNMIKNGIIVFEANNKCVFPAVLQDAICPITYRNVEGTWEFDSASGIVKVYYPKDFKKEFYDAFKEEHPHLQIPNPVMKMEFKVVGLENGRLEIEKPVHNPVYD